MTGKEIYGYYQYACGNEECWHIWSQDGYADVTDDLDEPLICPKCGSNSVTCFHGGT